MTKRNVLTHLNLQKSLVKLLWNKRFATLSKFGHLRVLRKLNSWFIAKKYFIPLAIANVQLHDDVKKHKQSHTNQKELTDGLIRPHPEWNKTNKTTNTYFSICFTLSHRA